MEQLKGIEVLALDLEGTLISNAMSQIARLGLRDFLEFCGAAFPRLAMYTFISEDRFRQIARMLVNEGSAPGWFDALEYIEWGGTIKDLRRIAGADGRNRGSRGGWRCRLGLLDACGRLRLQERIDPPLGAGLPVAGRASAREVA